MSRKFLVPVGLPSYSSDPSGTYTAGDSYFNSTTQVIKSYNGSTWVSPSSSALIDLDGGNATSVYGGLTSINAGTA
jgi:hypothetical protein